MSYTYPEIFIGDVYELAGVRWVVVEKDDTSQFIRLKTLLAKPPTFMWRHVSDPMFEIRISQGDPSAGGSGAPGPPGPAGPAGPPGADGAPGPSSGNLDGGFPDSVYGGTSPVDGGGP